MSAKIIKKDGRPQLYIDDRPIAPIIYGLSDFPGAAANTHYAYRNIQNFAKCGIHLVEADSALHLGWHKIEPYDAEAVSSELEAVLDANPDAKIILRLHLNPPYWWLRDNPEECTVYRTPEGDVIGLDDGEQDRLIRGDGNMRLRASFASQKWISEASEKLKSLLLALKNTRAGNALIGIHVAYGKNGEWHQWGTDVSQPMKQYFRQYLRETYKNDQALRKAWNNDTVSIESAEFEPQLFAPTDDGIFRDPKKSQQLIDSQKCHQKVVTDAILHFAKVVKETSPERLCGAFYGYYLGGGNSPRGGHLKIEDIYASDDIDFLCGPACYMDNRKPNGIPMQRTFLESNRLRGKLWLTEMDQFPFGVERRSGGTEEQFDVNVAMIRRNTLQPLFGGHGFWFYDHRVVPTLEIMRELGDTASDVASIYRKRGWWDEPKMMREIKKVRAFAQKFIKRDYTSDADVLVVYDVESQYYQFNARLGTEQYALFDAIVRNGAAYDSIYLSEFSVCEIERYKCIIFARCPHITEEMRTLIQEKTKGKTTVFLNGCGFCDGTTLSEESMSLSVGMSVKKTDAQTFSSAFEDETISLARKNTPYFAVTDPDAVPLARFDNGKIAAAAKGNSVFVSLPYLSKGIAKEIFQKSGVHIWCDSGEPIYAASGYVAIHCQGSGKRTLFLKNQKTIPVETVGHETMVFDTRSGKRVL